MPTYRYAGTLEFEKAPPLTKRGEVEAFDLEDAHRRAVARTYKDLNAGVINRASSAVVVILGLVEEQHAPGTPRRGQRHGKGEGATTDSGNLNYPPG
jgi:hypothetical protein